MKVTYALIDQCLNCCARDAQGDAVHTNSQECPIREIINKEEYVQIKELSPHCKLHNNNCYFSIEISDPKTEKELADRVENQIEEFASDNGKLIAMVTTDC